MSNTLCGRRSNKPGFGYHYIWCIFNLSFTKISKYWLVYWCDFGTTNSKKYGICTNFSKAVFFFHPQKKNRSIALWRRMEGTVCGYGEKKKPYPFGTDTGEFSKFYYVYTTGTKKITKKVRKTVRVRKKVPARYGKRYGYRKKIKLIRMTYINTSVPYSYMSERK